METVVDMGSMITFTPITRRRFFSTAPQHETHMDKKVVDQAHQTLAQCSALRDIDDASELRKALASMLERMERDFADLTQETDAPASNEDLEVSRLYARAARDFSAMQAELAIVRRALSDRAHMLRTLRGIGHDIDSTKQHLTLVGAMDQALQNLLLLMQYDTMDRVEIDVLNGFQLSCGSANYGRFYFAPPKENNP